MCGSNASQASGDASKTFKSNSGGFMLFLEKIK
jgi:hypothetical protein